MPRTFFSLLLLHPALKKKEQQKKNICIEKVKAEDLFSCCNVFFFLISSAKRVFFFLCVFMFCKHLFCKKMKENYFLFLSFLFFNGKIFHILAFCNFSPFYPFLCLWSTWMRDNLLESMKKHEICGKNALQKTNICRYNKIILHLLLWLHFSSSLSLLQI